MVGGISALIGAIMVGPRLGKYTRDANGKVIKVNAIPGHSLPLGALGCFILWFCWYGFNGAAAKSVAQLGQIFGTTTIAPAVATVVCMLFTWIKNKKPDVSMCLNASLAGLVAVTAGCTNVDAIGATIIGAVSGFLVVGVVELLDLKLHIDDPVGAVAVHCANGIWGTIAAGLFATSTSAGGVDGPIYALIHGTSFVEGLRVFGVQLAGLVAIAAWTTATMTLAFFIIKKTIGLRVTKEEEIVGLDRTEHGLPSAYADFPITVHDYDALPVTFIDVVPSTQGAVNSEAAVSVERKDLAEPKKTGEPKLTKVEIICRERMLEPLKNAMVDIGITGMTVTHVMGCGAQKGKPEYYRGVEIEPSLLPKVQLEMVVSKVPVRDVIETAKKVLYTGHIGDGKIFVYDVENAVKVRTGEEGYDALQDVE